jgi:hypothetical protein
MSTLPSDRELRAKIGESIDEQWYLSGKVRRFHTTHGVEQTLADHQWGAAIFLLRRHPSPSRDLLLAALTHDMPELITGDFPGPAKRAFPELAKQVVISEETAARLMRLPEVSLTKEEGLWLKLADFYECLQFAVLCVPEPFRSRIDKGKLRTRCHGICQELGIEIESPDGKEVFGKVAE